jgi:hypothetical protein
LNDSLIIKKITKNEIPKVTSLINSLYPYKKPNSYFLWQTFNYIAKFVMFGAFHEGKLIATFSNVQRVLTNNLACGQANCLAIHPEWRGKKLFSILGNKSFNYFNDLDLVFVFCNSDARIACEKSFGMEMYAIKSLLLDTEEIKSKKKEKEIEVIEVIDLNTNFCFPESLKKENTESTFLYNQVFLNWRYKKNPIYSYKLIRNLAGDYIIIKLFKDPLTNVITGDILQITFNSGNKNFLKKLIEYVLVFLKNNGAKYISTWANPGSQQRNIFLKLDFKENGKLSYFGLKINKSKYEYLYDFSQWNLQMVDAFNY